MYSRSGNQIRHGYSVIRVSLDDRRDHTVPVGVVAWQTTNPWYGWRWLENDEKVRGVDLATRRLMRITRNQIRRWAGERKVPYEPEPVEPTTDRFWKAVSEILTTAVRLEADALVSRFMRIRAAYPERTVRMIVGYSSSPGGLNGAIKMRTLRQSR